MEFAKPPPQPKSLLQEEDKLSQVPDPAFDAKLKDTYDISNAKRLAALTATFVESYFRKAGRVLTAESRPSKANFPST